MCDGVDVDVSFSMRFVSFGSIWFGVFPGRDSTEIRFSVNEKESECVRVHENDCQSYVPYEMRWFFFSLLWQNSLEIVFFSCHIILLCRFFSWMGKTTIVLSQRAFWVVKWWYTSIQRKIKWIHKLTLYCLLVKTLEFVCVCAWLRQSFTCSCKRVPNFRIIIATQTRRIKRISLHFFLLFFFFMCFLINEKQTNHLCEMLPNYQHLAVVMWWRGVKK